MKKKTQKTAKNDQFVTAQIGVSKCPVVAKKSEPLRERLDGNVARRANHKIGITWDIDLPGFGLRKRSKAQAVWIVKYRYRGQQRMRSLGSVRKVSAFDARTAAKRFIVEATLSGLPQRPVQKKVPCFADYVDEFWRDYAPHWKPRTRQGNLSYLRNHLIPAFGEMRIDQINRAELNRWRDSLAGRPVIFNRSIPIMSVMMGYAELLGFRAKGSNPCKGISRYKRDLPQRFLSANEYRRLGRVLAEAKRLNSPIVSALLMLIYTGARPNEIINLRWRYVQIPRLVLPDSKTGPKIIYLNRQASSVLEDLERGEDDDLVFRGKEAGRTVDLNNAWRRLRKTAALPDVRLHDLRHSFASAAIGDGVALATLGKLLGHVLPETTMRYAHLADDVIAKSSECICNGLAAAFGISDEQL